MKVLANLAKVVKEDGGFSAVYGQTLQDDAPPEIREANVKKLRALVENATKDGKRVLIVTNLIGARTIQAKLRDDLQGARLQVQCQGHRPARQLHQVDGGGHQEAAGREGCALKLWEVAPIVRDRG